MKRPTISMNVRIVAVVCTTLAAAGTVCAQTFEPNVDRPGSDYRAAPLSSPDPRLCQKTCIDEVACLAWTFDKPGKCWLKYAIPPPVAKDCCTSGVVRSAAGMKIAHAREAFEKRGLLGTFAQSCEKPVASSNQYIVYRAVDGERVQRDAMDSPTERASAYVFEVATEPAPSQLRAKGTDRKFRISYSFLLDGKRWRILQVSWDDGDKTVVDGRWQGTETSWYTKCE
jgi:PAN domain